MKLMLLGFLLFIMSFGSVVYAQPQSVFAQASLACDGLTPITDGGDCTTNTDEPNIGNTVKNILNILSVVAGIIAVVMIMIAGVKFMTSQGDPGKISSARSAVIYAVIGLVVVALSQIIVQFVIARSAPPPPTSQNTPADA
jgi:cytochrome bd-type quinol oxidase subunit 2